MKPGRSVSAHLITIILASAGVTGVIAQELERSFWDLDPSPWEKGYVQVGGFVTTFSSKLTFGIPGGANGSINAEDRLGLDSTLTVFRAEAMYRPGKSRRNQLDLAYGSYHREGNVTLSRDITIDGVTYSPGARIDTLFNFDLIRGSYSYAFLQNDRARVGLGLSVYAVPLKYGLTIETTGGRSNVQGADTTVPLPALALRAEVQVIPKLFLKASADGIYLEIDKFKGTLVDTTVGLEYRLWKHLGFGLGYNFVAAEVEGKASSDYPGVDFVGDVKVHFSGLLFYGKFAF